MSQERLDFQGLPDQGVKLDRLDLEEIPYELQGSFFKEPLCNKSSLTRDHLDNLDRKEIEVSPA